MFKSDIVAVKTRDISTISGLTMQKSDPSGLLIFEKLKYKAVSSSSVYNGKDSHCHLQNVPEFPVFHDYTSLMCYKHKTTEGKGFNLLLLWDTIGGALQLQGYTNPTPTLPGIYFA